jgi:hypothetical protein
MEAIIVNIRFFLSENFQINLNALKFMKVIFLFQRRKTQFHLLKFLI